MTFEEKIHVYDLGEVVTPILAQHRCTMRELASSSRKQHVVAARRALAVYLAKTAQWSNGTIGQLLGRDPSAVHNLLHPKKKRAAA